MHDTDPFFRVSHLSLQIGKFRLNDISLECARGEYHIIMGPGGSGKHLAIFYRRGHRRYSALAGINWKV